MERLIPILMCDAWRPEYAGPLDAVAEGTPFPNHGGVVHFGPSGRWLLNAALGSLGLTRHDEIAIVTTSDEVYVSICVSIPSFNYAKIARVVTASTRVAILIHEFGFVRDDAAALVDAWRRQGIVVIEDCAHLIGAVADLTAGTLGDYVLYSLPKIIPATYGGILTTPPQFVLPAMTADERSRTESARRAADRYLDKYEYFNQRRLENATAYRHAIGKALPEFQPSSRAIPFMVGHTTTAAPRIKAAMPHVEWGPTLRQDLLYCPTTALVGVEHFRQVATDVVALIRAAPRS